MANPQSFVITPMGIPDKETINRFLMKSSVPYYLFVVVTAGHSLINLGLGLPALVFFNLFAVFPILDEVISEDWTNPTLAETKEMEHSTLFTLPLYLGLMIDWLMTMLYLSRFP